ncbi:hypothetical protein AW736_20200 [Termitidicoccus mucosus]|uniref:Uncharacterized protein n=1 Tax=Termitidicoccus mucosus TaxID=1184151 RepID=A0A178IE05_9BACT|nr:hypothetical protein AW736_20200 [Opitutaceae bacterium TSB47]
MFNADKPTTTLLEDSCENDGGLSASEFDNRWRFAFLEISKYPCHRVGRDGPSPHRTKHAAPLHGILNLDKSSELIIELI